MNAVIHPTCLIVKTLSTRPGRRSHCATKNITDNSEDEGNQEDIVGHNGCDIRSSSPGHCVLVLSGSKCNGRRVCGNDGGGGEGRTSGRRVATFEFVVIVHDGDV